MRGKYKSFVRYYSTRAYRSVLRLFLRHLIRWKRLENPEPGYTVAIASHWRFPHMLRASLYFLSKQDLRHMDHVICAIDGLRDDIWEETEAAIKGQFPELKLEFLYQSPYEARVLRTIKWGWVDAWLSFCKCIAATKTTHIALHDNDAMLIEGKFIEDRYQKLIEDDEIFLGIGWYTSNGIEKSDRILRTINMVFDARFLRNQCQPIECFPHVRKLNSKTVDLDVLCQCQLKTDKKAMVPIEAGEWVHPSQVISQFSYLARNDGYKPPQRNNLFFIPYFEYIGGNPDILSDQTRSLESFQNCSGEFLGYPVDISALDDVHMNWIRIQIERVEKAYCGKTRPEVERYLSAIEKIVQPDQASAA